MSEPTPGPNCDAAATAAEAAQASGSCDVVENADDEVMEEVLEEEQGSLLSALLSQVHIGMDLSKVTLPTFILEPRSFLERMTDFFAHPHFIFEAAAEEDKTQRFLKTLKWYLSGFHIKPKGVKKPYNPILGESFRAWHEHADGSCTSMVCEQVSHHPPVSAFYIENRKNGFVVEAVIAPKSRFLGTSAACILNGHATVTLINRKEVYKFTFPTLYVRGLIFGKLLMEYGDKVKMECEQTGLSAEVEFKVKGYIFGTYNAIGGKIKDMNDKKTPTLYKIGGNWTTEITIEDANTKETTVFFDATKERVVKMKTPPEVVQEPTESRRLWSKVTAALNVRPKPDQEAATKWKTELEESQRAAVKERKEKSIKYETMLFTEVPPTEKGKDPDYIYKQRNLEPYNAEAERAAEEKFAQERQIMRQKAKELKDAASAPGTPVAVAEETSK